MMKRILAQTAGVCILLSGTTGNTYSATGDTTTITVTINVKGRTCQFDKTSDSITLETVRIEDFFHTSGIIGIKDVPVSINCTNNVDTVKIKASGKPATYDDSGGATDAGFFHNDGSAKHIGLAFMDKDGKQISSIGTSNNHVVVPLKNGKATYVFKAGYGALSEARYISGGSFQSSVNLTFDYE